VHDNVEIYIEDELKFYGKAGLFGKNRAVQIVSRVYQGMEEEKAHDSGK